MPGHKCVGDGLLRARPGMIARRATTHNGADLEFGHARAPNDDVRSNLAATEPPLSPYQCMGVQNIDFANSGSRKLDKHTRTHLISEAGRSRGRGRRRAAIRGDTTDDDRSAPSQIGQEACRGVNRCRRGGARVLSTSTA